MYTKVNNAIKLLSDKITGDVRSDDALKFTQAALNLAHVLAVQNNINEQPKAVAKWLSKMTLDGYCSATNFKEEVILCLESGEWREEELQEEQ